MRHLGKEDRIYLNHLVGGRCVNPLDYIMKHCILEMLKQV